MRYFTILFLAVALSACSSITNPTNGYRAQWYALMNTKSHFSAGRYEETVRAANIGIEMDFLGETGVRDVVGAENRYEMRLMRAESNLILGNFDGLVPELYQMLDDTPDEEVRTTVLLSRVFSKQNNSKRAVTELMSLVGPSPHSIVSRRVTGNYVLTRYFNEEWLEQYAETAQLVADQLAVVLSNDYGSIHPLKASIKLLKIGYRSDAMHKVVVSQMAKGYEDLPRRLATEYLEGFGSMKPASQLRFGKSSNLGR